MTIDESSYIYYLNNLEKFREPPCRYCPGNCITSCPTFTASRNTLLSPTGYIKSGKKVASYCLQCWRCSFSCPIKFPIPIIIEKYIGVDGKHPLNIRVIKDGRTYLVGEDEYVEPMIVLADKMGMGVKAIDLKHLPLSLDHLKSDDILIGYTPEAAFILGIPHFSEILGRVVKDLDKNIELHIPCLLLPRKDKIISGLERVGITVKKMVTGVCVRMSLEDGCLKGVYSLCPRAIRYEAYMLDELITC